MAPQVEPKRGIKVPWCWDIVCEENCRLLNSSRRYYNTFAGISSPFSVFFHHFLPFLGDHDVKWRPCISTLCSINIMAQVCFWRTWFGTQHILDPANHSSWAWHTKAILWAIPANSKSWAHLAALPFPNLWGAWWTPKKYVGHIGLDANSGACPGPSQTCTPFAPTMSVRIFGQFLPFSIFLP